MLDRPITHQVAPKALPIEIPEPAIQDFCQRHHIQVLALFGSVLREDFRDDSDVDILVQFLPGKTPGFQIVMMQDELTQLFGKVVDLRTPAELSRYFRDRVLSEAYILYKQA